MYSCIDTLAIRNLDSTDPSTEYQFSETNELNWQRLHVVLFEV